MRAINGQLKLNQREGLQDTINQPAQPNLSKNARRSTRAKKNKDTFIYASPRSPSYIPESISRFTYRNFFQNYIKLIYPHPLSPSTHPITFICIHSVTRYGFDQKTDYICNSIESDATNSSIRLHRYYYIDASRLKVKKRERKRAHSNKKKALLSLYTLR